MTSGTTSLGVGLAMLGMLIYGIFVVAQGLINGEKRRLLRANARINRWRNPGTFWFYTGVDIIVCVLLAFFAFYFLYARI